ncbi:MAG: response regulator [Lentimicrobium sp.]|jgi:CheY-like chemotaxis protein|nr:response regulator [Lentimicrobium sp.]
MQDFEFLKAKTPKTRRKHNILAFGNREKRPKKTLANKQYYRSLIQGRREGCLLADIDGEIVLINPVFEAFSGYTEDELAEIKLSEIFLSIEGALNPLAQENLKESNHNFYFLLATSVLKPVTLELKEIEGQKYLGIIHESFDSPAVTDHPEESKERQSINEPDNTVTSTTSKPNPKEPLADGNLQHEIRTMLSGILGYGAVLKLEKTISADKRIDSYVEGILNNGQKIKAVLDKSISTDSKKQQLNLSLVSPLLVIRKIIILLGSFSKEQNVEIENTGSEDYLVFSDENRLQNILYYLIHKAISYSRTGKVSLSIDKDVSLQKLNIEIDNIGIDIPNAVMHEINREKILPEYNIDGPVFSNNPEIAEVLSDLNLIEGKLEFKVQKQYEQMVTLSLPLNSENSREEILESIEAEITKKKVRILIVEDNKINARILSLFLENISTTEIAYSGNEALNLIERAYHSGNNYNIVFMDIGLPEPWDGIILKKEIEKRWPAYQMIPFVAQTAFAQDRLTERILQGDFRKCLIKPIDRLIVLQTVKKLI